ncbi:hypothetical protein AB5I83_08210 [Mesobacillus sp. LC4]
MLNKILSWKLTPSLCLGIMFGSIIANMGNFFSAIIFSVSGLIFLKVVIDRIETLKAELKKRDINL